MDSTFISNCRNGKLSEVNKALEAKSSLNEETMENALIESMIHNQIEILKILLSNKKFRNILSKNQPEIMFFAYNNTDILLALLEYQEFKVLASKDLLVVDEALKSKNEHLQNFLNLPDTLKTISHDYVLVCTTIKQNRLDTIKLILQIPESINILADTLVFDKTIMSNQVLIFKCLTEKPEICALLAKDKSNLERIFTSSINNENEIFFKTLLNTPFFKEYVTEYSNILIKAIRQNRLDIIKLILQETSIYKMISSNSQVFETAIKENAIEIIKMFLELIDLRNKLTRDTRPLLCAIKNNRSEIIQLLLDTSEVIESLSINNSILAYAIEYDDTETFGKLIARPEVQKTLGRDTLLPLFEDFEVVKFLPQLLRFPNFINRLSIKQNFMSDTIEHNNEEVFEHLIKVNEIKYMILDNYVDILVSAYFQDEINDCLIQSIFNLPEIKLMIPNKARWIIKINCAIGKSDYALNEINKQIALTNNETNNHDWQFCKNIFQAAHGNILKLTQSLINKTSLNKYYENIINGFSVACHNNNVSIAKLIITELTNHRKLDANEAFWISTSACQSNNVEIIQYLFELHIIQIADNKELILENLSIKGNIYFFKLLFKNDNFMLNIRKNNDILYNAIEGNQIEIVNLLISSNIGFEHENINESMFASISNGQLDILKLLLSSKVMHKHVAENNNLALAACLNVNMKQPNCLLDIAIRLLEEQSVFANADQLIFDNIIHCRHENVMITLLKKSLDFRKLITDLLPKEVLIQACKQNHSLLLSYLLCMPELNKQASKLDEFELYEIISNENYFIIEQLIKIPNIAKMIKKSPKANSTLKSAYGVNLYEHFLHDLNRGLLIPNDPINEWLLIKSCELNDLNTLRHQLKIQNIKSTIINKESSLSQRLLNSVARNGNTTMLKFLIKKPFIYEKFKLYHKLILATSCHYGHLELTKFLLTIDFFKTSIADNGNAALLNAIESGQLLVVKELLKYELVLNKVAFENNLMLRVACGNGNFEIAKYLLSIESVREIVAIRDNLAIKRACDSNNLDLVELLFKEDEVKKLIDGNEHWVLRWACTHAHFHLISSILNIPTDQYSLAEIQALQHSDDARNNLILGIALELIKNKKFTQAFDPSLSVQDLKQIMITFCKFYESSIVQYPAEYLLSLPKVLNKIISSFNDNSKAPKHIYHLNLLLDNYEFYNKCMALTRLFLYNDYLPIINLQNLLSNINESHHLLNLPCIKLKLITALLKNEDEAQSYNKLINACTNNDVKEVKILLLLPSVINQTAKNSNLAFRLACFQGFSELALQLLNYPEVEENFSINSLCYLKLSSRHPSLNQQLSEKLISSSSVDKENKLLAGSHNP